MNSCCLFPATLVFLVFSNVTCSDVRSSDAGILPGSSGVFAPPETDNPAEPTASVSEVHLTDSVVSTPLIDLDISTQQSTESCDYRHDESENSHTFTAKNGHRFSNITKGLNLLTVCDSEINKIVVAYSDNRDILLSFFSGNSKHSTFSVFKDPDVSNTNVAEQYLSSATSRVTLFSETVGEQIKNIASSDESDVDDFNVVDLTNLFNYVFNTDCKCTEVKYENTTLWKYDKATHGDHFPTNVLVNTGTKLLLVECGANFQYFYSFNNNEWREGLQHIHTRGADHRKLKFMTPSTHDLNVEMDTESYELKESNHTFTFTFKPNVKCTEVTYGSKTLWKHNSDENGSFYPTSVTLYSQKGFLMVDSPGVYRYLYSFYDNVWKLVFGYRSQETEPVCVDFITIVTLNSDRSRLENDPDQYFKTDHNQLIEFRFKDETKCDEIKYNDKTVWKYSADDHHDSYPTSLTLKKNKNILLVDCARYYLHVYGYYNKEWVELPFGYKQETLFLHKLSVVTKNSDGTYSTNDRKRYRLERFPNAVVFRFMHGTQCFQVLYDDKLIWKYSVFEHSGSFPTLVRLNNKNNTLLVELSKNKRYFYEYHEKHWTLSLFGYRFRSILVTNLNLVTLVDGSYTSNDRTQYKIDHPGNRYIFRFEDQAKCAEVWYLDKALWTYNLLEHGSDFPTSVTFNSHTAIIIVESRRKYQYFYSYYQGQWKLIYVWRSMSILRLYPAKLKFFSCDDEGHYSELGPTSFTVEESTEVPGSFTFRFNPGTKCSLVKYGDEELWRHSKAKHGANYLTSVTLNTVPGTIHLESHGNYSSSYSYDTESRTFEVAGGGEDEGEVSVCEDTTELTEVKETQAEDAKKKAENVTQDANAAKKEADQAKQDAETAKLQAETAKLQAETAKLQAEIAKLQAETAKLQAENANNQAGAPKEASEQKKNTEAEKAGTQDSEQSKTFQNPQNSIKLINLDIKNNFNTNEYKYSKDNKSKRVTFDIDKGYGVEKVFDGNDAVWKAEDSQLYVTKVFVDGKGSSLLITLMFPDGRTRQCYKESGKWVLSHYGIVINVATKTSGKYYDCFEGVVNGITTWFFIPRDCHLFRKVTDSERVFYTAEHFSDYAKRLDLTPTSDGHHIDVHVDDEDMPPLPNGTKRVVHDHVGNQGQTVPVPRS